MVFHSRIKQEDTSSKSNKQKEKKSSQKKEIKQIKKQKRISQKVLPYQKMFQSGIALLDNNRYSATVKIEDINYDLVSDESREEIFTSWMEFLNAQTPEEGMNITIHNHFQDKSEFEKTVCLPYNEDGLDHYRAEMNEVLIKNIKSGNNNIYSDKYLSFCVKEDSLEEATREFNIQLMDIIRRLKAIDCKVENDSYLDGTSRLNLISNIINPTREMEFSYDTLDGLTTKDIIAPDSFDFSPCSSFRIDDRYCKILFLKNYSTELCDEFISDLSKLQYSFTINYHLRVLNNTEALDLVQKQKAAMEMNKISEERKAVKYGYGTDMIPEDIKYSLKEAELLLNDVKKRNQRLFICQFVILLNCESREELQEVEKRMRSVAKKYNLELGGISYLQELGFQASLPLCYSQLPISRTLTTAPASTLIPFTSMELLHKGKNSVYYGINAGSGNLILCDRTKLLNPSGWILGKPGGGKSFSVKREMLWKRFADPAADIICLDPENEYGYIANLPNVNGTVIHINNSSNIFLNPLDGDISDKDFMVNKIEFLQSMVSVIVGDKQMTPINISLIDRVGRAVYASFFDKLERYKIGKLKKKPEVPTFTDFYNLMDEQEEKEAKQMARAMEIYVNGTNNFFAKQSNISVRNQLIVYEIRDLAESMKPLAMQIILENIWQRVIHNKKIGKSTWIYMDEIYIFLQLPYCRRYFQTLWKRARKYNATLTGITQNVEEVLANIDTRTMLSNSEFVMMLNQAVPDREALAQIFNISDEQMNYISNSIEGSGLLCYGGAIVPFIDKFPKNTELYRAMTTKPKERTEIDQGLK